MSKALPWRLAAVVLSALITWTTAAGAATAVFINEIHYDNVGTDTGERIEIAGPAGTNLAGWAIVRYNGATPTSGVVYTSPAGPGPLSGIIPDQQTGFGTLAFSYPTDGLQNGPSDGIALVDPSGVVVQFISYEGTMVAGNGPAAGMTSTDIGASETASTPVGFSVQLSGSGTAYEDFTWTGPIAHSFGAVNANQTFGGPPPDTFGACGGPVTRIHAIQGSGTVTPMAGAEVVVEAVVVGAFPGAGGLGGFFLQEQDGQHDGDAATSEGIFVFDTSLSGGVVRGDVVRLRGRVSEFDAQTEIAGVNRLEICAQGLRVTPTPVTLPLAAVADWERYEGMLVSVAGPLAVTENFNLGAFGEVVLATDRLMIPTQVALPGAPALAVQALNDRSRIVLDDGSNLARANLSATLFPEGGLSATHTLRTGDVLLGPLVGVLSQAFGAYRVHPVDPASLVFTPANPRPAAPTAPGANLRVASFNVLNYFTTLDTGAPACGPAGALDCRGANSALERTRQRDKILAALGALDADVVGLIELENNPSASIADLVAGLIAAGAGPYAFVDTGTIGTDAIKVGLIYKPAAVAAMGPFAILDDSVDARARTSLNRPALAQTFRHAATGQRLTVVVNHFKSKGSPCDAVGDPDAGDGQGNCNLTRLDFASALVDWLATDPTGNGDPDVLVIGDLNSYAMEDPIRALTAAGYANQVQRFLGDDAWSFVFQGQSGYLDHALATPGLARRIIHVAEWHINADEPVALDYNVEWTGSVLKTAAQQARYYEPGPYRASDHDPLVVALRLPSLADDAVEDLRAAIAALAGFPAAAFSNASHRPTLVNKLEAVIRQVQQRDVAGALDKLRHDLVAKSAGCLQAGTAGKTDWIVTCPEQTTFSALLLDALGDLRQLAP